MTTPLFILRAYQIGLTLSDLDQMDYGFVLDMIIESGNDSFDYQELATQEDMDKF